MKTMDEQNDNSTPMSFLDMLKEPSVLDLLSSIQLSPDEVDALKKASAEKSTVKPFIKFVDMNNCKDDKQYNKPKSSIVIGIDVEF